MSLVGTWKRQGARSYSIFPLSSSQTNGKSWALSLLSCNLQEAPRQLELEIHDLSWNTTTTGTAMRSWAIWQPKMCTAVSPKAFWKAGNNWSSRRLQNPSGKAPGPLPVKSSNQSLISQVTCSIVDEDIQIPPPAWSWRMFRFGIIAVFYVVCTARLLTANITSNSLWVVSVVFPVNVYFVIKTTTLDGVFVRSLGCKVTIYP